MKESSLNSMPKKLLKQMSSKTIDSEELNVAHLLNFGSKKRKIQRLSNISIGKGKMFPR